MYAAAQVPGQSSGPSSEEAGSDVCFNGSTGKMLTSNRNDYLARSLKRSEITDDLTRRNFKKKRTTPTKGLTKGKGCNERVKSESLSSGDLHPDSNQGVRSEPIVEVTPDLSKSVVSLALSDGHTVLFACSGIAVERVGCVTRLLTTASLVKAINDKRKGHDDNLKIEVRHEGNTVVGFLGEYDFDHNIAAVNVENIPDLCAVPFIKMWKKFVVNSKVISLGRDIFGKLIVTSGTWNGFHPEYGYDLMLSTCKISKDCEGGPVFDFVGNFVGMNLSVSMEGTVFLPAVRVLDRVVCCKSLQDFEFPTQ